MDPLSVLGLASNIVQLVQFVGTVISTSHEIYQSADGISRENLTLEDVARNLRELSSELNQTRMPQSAEDKPSDAEKQLQNLCRECNIETKKLLKKLDSLKIKGPHKRWNSFQHALGSVLSQNEIHSLESKLASIRAQLDTTLLICMRERLEQSQKDPLEPYLVKFREEVDKQYERIVDTIRQIDQKIDAADYLQQFSENLDASADLRKESRFCSLILSRLEYKEMPDRYDTIREAHKQTFEWVFRDAVGTTHPWDNFTTWLEKPEPDKGDIYWITGKPGSGKSTLMKFIYNDPRTLQHLKNWAGNSNLVAAGFFFWCSGTAMQMSRLGLLRALLYQVLQRHPSLTTRVFNRRWQQYSSFRNGLHEWSWLELKNAFELLISESSLQLAFFIDGLDEFDGDHKELVQLVFRMARLPYIKVCCASRPWLVFQDAFENRPSLLLEQLTFQDIKRYVSDRFSQNNLYASLQEREPGTASLVDEVVGRASGVFLWVFLVVNSLLEGIQNSDKMSDLQRRLESLPTDLEGLFDRLLNSLDPFYFKQACQLIQIVRASSGAISLLHLSFADEDDPAKAAIEAEMKLMTETERDVREEDMRRRLNSRCKCLLEVQRRQVQWLHRTVKDFIDAPHIWAKITRATDASFTPGICLASALLYKLKCTNRNETRATVIATFLTLVVGAEQFNGKKQVGLLDEMDRVSKSLSATPSFAWHKFTSDGPKSYFSRTLFHGHSSYILSILNSDSSRLDKGELNELLRVALLEKCLSLPPSSRIEVVKKALERGADPNQVIESNQFEHMEPDMKKLLKPHMSIITRYKKSWHRRRPDFRGKLRGLARLAPVPELLPGPNPKPNQLEDFVVSL